MLEETGLPYRVVPVDVTKGDQFAPNFRAISPNNRVPAILDHDVPHGPQAVFESGAILIYLAEKVGRFLAPSGPDRVATLEWLMWQMGGLGPMAGQAHYFLRSAPEGNEYAQQRYVKETTRLYGVLNTRLEGRAWIAGANYSIADIACWGWTWFHQMQQQCIDDFPEVRRWFLTMSDRPAVQRGKNLGQEAVSEEMRKALNGPWYVRPNPGAQNGKG